MAFAKRSAAAPLLALLLITTGCLSIGGGSYDTPDVTPAPVPDDAPATTSSSSTPAPYGGSAIREAAREQTTPVPYGGSVVYDAVCDTPVTEHPWCG